MNIDHSHSNKFVYNRVKTQERKTPCEKNEDLTRKIQTLMKDFGTVEQIKSVQVNHLVQS